MLSVIYEPKGRAREYGELAANLYKGCGHGCEYCYAPSATFTEKKIFHEAARPRPGILDKFEKDCQALKNTGKRILLSFTTDPYQPIDQEYGLTRKAIEILKSNGLNVEILTKGGTRALRDFDLLKEEDYFATTMTFLDPRKSMKWEPGAALPDDRMEAMRYAHSLGIKTWVSLEPVIDPAETLEIIRQTHEVVDLYKVGTLNYHPLSQSIDWDRFGREATQLLRDYGKDYYIKKDLRQKIRTDSYWKNST